MSETGTRAAVNGVVRIGRKGKMKFAFGDDGTPFDVDVIDVNNEWSEIDRTFRDESGNVPTERLKALNDRLWEYVKEKSRDASVSKAEALEFMRLITEEAARLKDFFVPKLDKKEPSSPDATTTLRFTD